MKMKKINLFNYIAKVFQFFFREK